MNSLVEKISEYHIFNFLLPGYSLVVFLEWNGGSPIMNGDIISKIIMAYVGGMLISRLGSLILEPIYKVLANRVKFLSWLWADYGDYCRAIKTAPRIKIFVQDANMYRTFCALCFVISCYGLFLTNFKICAVSAMIAILMFLAYSKQNTRIAKNVMVEIRQSKTGGVK